LPKQNFEDYVGSKGVSLSPQASPHRALRIATFLRERFPLWPAFAGLFLQSALSLIALGKLSFPGALWNSISTPSVLVQSFSIPLMFLLVRIADELKDFEADQRLFPDRPLARGAVFLSDLHVLALVLVGILVVLHLALRWFEPQAQLTSFLFVASLLFIFLMWKWFFCEKQIRPSLPLALVTHNPSAFLLNLFLLSILPWSADIWRFALGAWAAAAAWEIGRKIKPIGGENEYTTYSKIWGPRRSMLLVMVLCVLSTTLQLSPFLGFCSAQGLWVFAPALLGLGLSLSLGSRFLLDARAPSPREVTAGVSFGVMLSLVLIVFFADLSPAMRICN